MIHEALNAFPHGFWARGYSVQFFNEDSEGNVKHYGTMNFEYYLIPPFEGFVLTANPTSIAPGEASALNIHAVEMPDEPVIIPENTAVDMLMDETGAHLGGFLLPEIDPDNKYNAILNFPYSLLTNTPIFYEADVNPLLQKAGGHVSIDAVSETVSIGMRSSHNWSIWGITTLEVREDGEETDLKILYPTSNTENFYISSVPEMPHVAVEAQLMNYSGGEVHFHWEYKVEYSFSRYGIRGNSRYDLCDRKGVATFKGTSTSQNSEISTWQVLFENENADFSYIGMTRDCSDFRESWNGTGDVLIGGQNTVTVTAETTDGQNYTDTITANKILGSNPSVAEVKSGLSLKEQVVAYKETWHTARWKHFNIADRSLQYNRIGMPAYGYPNGFGLFQIDNPPSNEERLWNWRANRQAGVNLLEQKRIDAEDWPRRIRRRANDPKRIGYQNTPDFETEEQLWKETFQRYNGGAYWEWDPDFPDDPNSNGKWIIVAPTNYGIDAWNLYENVSNDNFPGNWE